MTVKKPLEIRPDTLLSKGTRTNAGGWSCTTYDTRGRVSQQTYPAYGIAPVRTVTTTRSTDGLTTTTTTTDPAGAVTSAVDLLGRVTSSTDTWNKTTTATYDPVGRPATTTGPNGTLTTAYRPRRAHPDGQARRDRGRHPHLVGCR